MAKPSEPVPSYGRNTVYRGVEFKSQCEARWAALFDLLGFEWEYEPNGPVSAYDWPRTKVMVSGRCSE